MKNIVSNVLSNNMILFPILVVLIFIVYQKDPFHFTKIFYSILPNFESAVISGIIAEDSGIDKKGANTGFLGKGNYGPHDKVLSYRDVVGDNSVMVPSTEVLDIFASNAKTEYRKFVVYDSMFGFQEIVFSKIHKLLRSNSFYERDKLFLLQSINSIFLAIVVVSLFFVYREVYDRRFAVIFLITLLVSPSIVTYARSLYFVSFLWFAPALLAALLYRSKGVVARTLLLLAIVFAIFIKSLCGYEYLPPITLFACSVFVVAPFFGKTGQNKSIDWIMVSFVFAACVFGCIGALVVHAGMRGDTLLAGFHNIVEMDLKRRTYGDPNLFPPEYRASLTCSFLTVLKMYIFDWTTALVPGFSGSLFKLLIIISLAGICYKYKTKHVSRHRDLILFSFFFIVPVSWFVLFKGHSYIHTFLNFVLWYFGFVQAVIYISLNTVALWCLRWAKTADVNDL